MAENHPAQRAEQKTDAKGGKGGERAHRRTNLGEKFTVKNQRGGNAVEQKIVPVDYRTGKTAEGRAARAMQRWYSPVGGRGGEGGIHSDPV